MCRPWVDFPPGPVSAEQSEDLARPTPNRAFPRPPSTGPPLDRSVLRWSLRCVHDDDWRSLRAFHNCRVFSFSVREMTGYETREDVAVKNPEATGKPREFRAQPQQPAI